MKKYIFIINKKIVFYIIIYFLLLFIGLCLRRTSYYFIIIYIVMFLYCIRFIIFNLEFDDNSIVSGWIFGKIMHYKNIGKVLTDGRNLVIYSNKGLTDSIKINLSILNYNIDKTRDVILEIYDRTNKNLSLFSRELKEFIKGEKKNLYTSSFENLILLIQILIVILLINDVIATFNDIKSILLIDRLNTVGLLIGIKIVITLLILIYAIYTLRLFNTYNHNAPRVMKYYRWTYVVYKTIAETIVLILAIINDNPISFSHVFNAILSITTTLIMTLIIVEYLSTSKIVKWCFGNEEVA